MISKLLGLIREHPNDSLAILAAVAILTSAFVDPAWWGSRSQGVLIGIACSVVIVLIVAYLLEKVMSDIGPVMSWLIVAVPTGIALLLRKAPPIGGIHLPGVRFTIPLPMNASPQSVMLVLDGLILFIFIVALVRSLSRGESVSVESHWGGLGGGIAGWRLSAPLIYLLAIAFLLAISSAVAWRLFPPPTLPTSQTGQQQQGHPVGTANTSSSPAGTPSH
jgi:hypothetical protein